MWLVARQMVRNRARGRQPMGKHRMSRARSRRRLDLVVMARSGKKPTANDTGDVAENIGFAALDLARCARAAGLTALGYLLECAALEAGAEAAARKWPVDASGT